MQKVITLYKPVSYTPLQTIEEYLRKNSEYADVKLGYAGRLDPMASGVLLVLAGDENLKRKEYERLPKEYEFEVLFGVSTDTYDVMGRIQRVLRGTVLESKLQSIASQFLGRWEQAYPPYSSVLVRGKPLYFWARSGKISEIDIPSKMIQVEEIAVLEMRTIVGAEVVKSAIHRILNTQGEFRQQDIISDWRGFEKKYSGHTFFMARMCVACSSGVYVRGIAHRLGEKIGLPALAYSITRTSVGAYNLSSAVRIDSINA